MGRKTGHMVGRDPMTGRIVILRKGLDGKAARQVDVLDDGEVVALMRDLAVVTQGGHGDTVREIPSPEQVTLDLFATPEPERPTP